MSRQDFLREREKKIIELIGRREVKTVEVAMPLEMDCGTTGSVLNTMARRGMIEKKMRVVYGMKRKTIYWRVK